MAHLSRDGSIIYYILISYFSGNILYDITEKNILISYSVNLNLTEYVKLYSKHIRSTIVGKNIKKH